MALEILSREIEQEKEIKDIYTVMEDVTFSPFTHDMVYIENPKVSSQKLIELISKLCCRIVDQYTKSN